MLQSRRVLVVDDEPFARELLRRTLEPLGWTVTEAADLDGARDALAKGEP